MINSRSVMSAHTLVCCTAACTCYQCAGVSICVFVWFLIFLYSNSNMNLKTTEPSNWGRFESLPVKRRNRCAHTHSCLSSQFPLHGWINLCLPSQILTLVSQNKTSVSILTKAQLFNQDENKTIKQKKTSAALRSDSGLVPSLQRVWQSGGKRFLRFLNQTFKTSETLFC